ncbi:MAG: LytTR family DNA-binding domain-containing protein [Salinivirgaceae bacterium]|jgi:two-component system LytT family response regulator
MNTNDPIKLSIHSQNEIEFIEIESIVRMEAEGCYTNVFLHNGRKITVSKSLGEYESILLNAKFVRVHNSHIVNLKHIKKFLKKDGLILQMTDDYMVPIAVRRKDVFEEKMKMLVI